MKPVLPWPWPTSLEPSLIPFLEHDFFFFFLKKKNTYSAAPALSCSMQSLELQHVRSSSRPEIKPGPPALGAGSLSPWTSREVHEYGFLFLSFPSSAKTSLTLYLLAEQFFILKNSGQLIL